jgi:phosphoribosylformylglycinamidine cyclo-ligase
MSTAVKTSDKPMTYKDAGVNYEGLDPFKIACMERAAKTAHNADRLGVEPLEWTRGESCYVAKVRGTYWGFVVETLGTKNLAADNFRQQLIIADATAHGSKRPGRTLYDKIMKSTVAVSVNDLAPLGISPVFMGMHAALSSDEFLADKERAHELIEGWGNACDEAGCIWSGGETPGLGSLVMAKAGIFSGAASGISKTGKIIDSRRIKDGDVMSFFGSTGIHDNGLSLGRRILEKLPEKYMTRLPSGSLAGDALLEGTHIYCDVIEDLLDAGVDLHGAVNVTGHAFLKLSRARQPFTYIVDELPKCPEILKFLIEQLRPRREARMLQDVQHGHWLRVLHSKKRTQ